MQMVNLYLRSIIFYITVVIVTVVYIPFISISMIFRNKKSLLKASHFWCKNIIYLLKVCCNLEVKIEGRENIKEPMIIASKHQSALETIVLYSMVKEAKFILKDSLIYIPILGICWKMLDMVFIDRKSALKAMKKIRQEGEKHLKSGRSIIIFPEGTRTMYGQETEIKPGVTALYDLGIASCLPIGVNSGKFWPKNSIIKYPGTCIIKIGEPIVPGKNKKEFIEILRKKIDDNSK